LIRNFTFQFSSLFYISVFIANSDQDGNIAKESGERLLIPISIKSSFWKSNSLIQNSEFFVEISAKKTVQSVRIPIRVVMDSKCDELSDPSWSTLLGFFLVHYETVMVAIICIFITWIYAVKKSSASTSPAAGSLQYFAFIKRSTVQPRLPTYCSKWQNLPSTANIVPYVLKIWITLLLLTLSLIDVPFCHYCFKII